MSCYSRIRRQQILQEVEGYIDLIRCFAHRWTLKAELRYRLANRAIETLDRLDHTEANHLQALYYRGQALRFLQRYEDAVEPLRDASELDPENVHINLALAWCYKRIGRIDMAIQSLEEALEIAPNMAIIHYNLACYWSLASHVGLTLIHLSRAMEIDPTYRDAIAVESDFDPVRDHPEFLALTSAVV